MARLPRAAQVQSGGGKDVEIKATAIEGNTGAGVLQQLNTLTPMQQIASFKVRACSHAPRTGQ
ncbi:MAG: hypothetical protein U0176_15235 [Bacteroidia bacterium]